VSTTRQQCLKNQNKGAPNAHFQHASKLTRSTSAEDETQCCPKNFPERRRDRSLFGNRRRDPARDHCSRCSHSLSLSYFPLHRPAFRRGDSEANREHSRAPSSVPKRTVRRRSLIAWQKRLCSAKGQIGVSVPGTSRRLQTRQKSGSKPHWQAWPLAPGFRVSELLTQETIEDVCIDFCPFRGVKDDLGNWYITEVLRRHSGQFLP
jgi:hypothetical protein